MYYIANMLNTYCTCTIPNVLNNDDVGAII